MLQGPPPVAHLSLLPRGPGCPGCAEVIPAHAQCDPVEPLPTPPGLFLQPGMDPALQMLLASSLHEIPLPSPECHRSFRSLVFWRGPSVTSTLILP